MAYPTTRLEEMNANDFLTPSRWLCGFDDQNQPDNVRGMAFQRGVYIGNNCKQFSIGVNNVWCADLHEGRRVFRGERLGFDSGSSDFFAGVLSTNCRVVLYRRGVRNPIVLREGQK